MLKNRLPAIAAVMAVAAAPLFAATPLFAADVPAPPVFFPPPPPVYSWTGLYFGANAGYAFDTAHAFNTTGNTGAATPATLRLESNGVTAGLGLGYNYEFFNIFGTPAGIVVGVEGDAAYTDLNKTATSVGPAPGAATTATGQTQYVGTGRARFGVAYDKFLVYGTGGVAFGGIHDNTSVFNAAGAQIYGGSRDTIGIGYAYGGGIQYLIPTGPFGDLLKAASVAVKLEYIHYDLGQGSYQLAAPPGAFASERVRVDGNIVRAGISYKFGPPMAPPMAPVYAKY